MSDVLKVKTCDDVTGPEPCCISCHEDVEYGFELIEVEMAGFLFIVCCAQARNLDKAAKDV